MLYNLEDLRTLIKEENFEVIKKYNIKKKANGNSRRKIKKRPVKRYKMY